jgi:hypothetical protein
LVQVAEAAVKHAREKHIDVVLVDTAGRMQVLLNIANNPMCNYLSGQLASHAIAGETC